MRYATIVTLATLLSIPPAVTGEEQQDTPDCNVERMLSALSLEQLKVSASPTPETYANVGLVLEEKINHCSEEEVRQELKVLLAFFVFEPFRNAEEYNEVAKKYNSLLHNYDKLASDASELVKEVKVLREEKRALQMGQDLLLRMQAISLRISSAPPPPRRLHCKSRTTGAIMPFGSFAGVTSTSRIECTEE